MLVWISYVTYCSQGLTRKPDAVQKQGLEARGLHRNPRHKPESPTKATHVGCGCHTFAIDNKNNKSPRSHIVEV